MKVARFRPIARIIAGLSAVSLAATVVASPAAQKTAEGPASALAFAEAYKGERVAANQLDCFPDACGVPFAACEHIIPMTATLWTPKQIIADFQTRADSLSPRDWPIGIIVLLKTERCATKAFRGCSITTAALEKRSTPLAKRFLIYGLQLKPRDNDTPPGSLKIETGVDAWKNDAAGEYQFQQGPGATLVFLDPITGAVIEHTDAARLGLMEGKFLAAQGETPLLHKTLQAVIDHLTAPKRIF